MSEFDEYVIGKKKGLPIYLPIFIIPPNYRSECPFFEIVYVETEEGQTIYVGRCRIRNQYLTRHSVEKCVKYWGECPYYKMGLKRESG